MMEAGQFEKAKQITSQIPETPERLESERIGRTLWFQYRRDLREVNSLKQKLPILLVSLS